MYNIENERPPEMPTVQNSLVYQISFSAITADFEKWALQISTISKIHWTY